nr:MAG TPA: hypothetical protein [Caudoviricetes sp.]
MKSWNGFHKVRLRDFPQSFFASFSQEKIVYTNHLILYRMIFSHNCRTISAQMPPSEF